MEKGKFCPAMWFSGFFGLGALVHFMRFVLQVPLQVGSFQVPLSLSAIAAVVLGALSGGLLYLAVKPPCCSRQ